MDSEPPPVPIEIELSTEAAEALRVAAEGQGLSPGELAANILASFPALPLPRVGQLRPPTQAESSP